MESIQQVQSYSDRVEVLDRVRKYLSSLPISKYFENVEFNSVEELFIVCYPIFFKLLTSNSMEQTERFTLMLTLFEIIEMVTFVSFFNGKF